MLYEGVKQTQNVIMQADTNKKHNQQLNWQDIFTCRKQPVWIWLPSLYSQWDKDCEFSCDAWSPLYCDKALWWLAPVEDMYSHTLQDDLSDWVQDNSGAGDQVLQRLRTSRLLLCPAWVHCASSNYVLLFVNDRTAQSLLFVVRFQTSFLVKSDDRVLCTVGI